MLHLAGAETESPAAADREIRARTTQARRQQQTCQQRKAASLGVGAAVSNFCRSDGKEHPAEFCIELADASRLVSRKPEARATLTRLHFRRCETGRLIILASFAEQLPDHLFHGHLLDVDIANITLLKKFPAGFRDFCARIF